MNSNSPSDFPRRRIRVEPLGEWVLVDFVDAKILDEQNVQAIGDELFDLTEAHHQVVLNFASVEFLSSAMLGKLITFQRRIVQRGGRLILCSVNSDIQELFSITKLNKLMYIAASVSDALPMLSSQQVGIGCPWDGCGHQIVLPLVALIDAGYCVQCPACETGLKLALSEGLEGDQAWVSSFTVPTYDKQSLKVLSSHASDRRPTAPFIVHLPEICELYVADAVERIVRTLPAPRQVVLHVGSLQELSPRAASRLEAVAQGIAREEALVALYKKSDAPPPFEWPTAIPLFTEWKQAESACAAAGRATPLVVGLRHFGGPSSVSS